MLCELLALPKFNGNKLAEKLQVNYHVLSRHKKDGAFSKANFLRLKELYRLYAQKDCSAIAISQEEKEAIELAAVDAYKKALKTRIEDRFGRKFKSATIRNITKHIDATSYTTVGGQSADVRNSCIV